MARDGHGDHDALPHPPRELMRVVDRRAVRVFTTLRAAIVGLRGSDSCRRGRHMQMRLISMLAAAQDVFSSGGSNTDQWNPGGSQICQKHVAQYNELTPQIKAAAKASSSQARSSGSPSYGT
jgi:hypothetical protein